MGLFGQIPNPKPSDQTASWPDDGSAVNFELTPSDFMKLSATAWDLGVVRKYWGDDEGFASAVYSHLQFKTFAHDLATWLVAGAKSKRIHPSNGDG